MAMATVKTQALLKDFPPKFDCEEKQSLNGLIKLSRWEWYSERKTPVVLEKHPIKIAATEAYYTYHDEEAAQDDKADSFWVNFSDERLFADCDQGFHSQSDMMALSHPLLLSCVAYIERKKTDLFKPLAEENKNPTPFVFQHVPRWVNVQNSRDFGENDVITCEEKSNIIAMKAPSGDGTYTEAQIAVLLKTVLVAFGGAAKASAALKRNASVIHTGNWGCGNYGNNEELIYLVQMLGASAAGFEKIMFHAPNEDALEKAKAEFAALPESLSFQNMKNRLFEKGFRWQRKDLKEQLAERGLSFGMTEKDWQAWASALIRK